MAFLPNIHENTGQ